MPRLNAFTNRIIVGKGLRRRVALNIVVSSNRDTYSLTPGVALTNLGYVAGMTDITFTVNSGVYLYSVLTSQAGLEVGAFTAGDTVSIVNNGFILGKGGSGAGANPAGGTTTTAGENGGPAMNINYPVSITNNNYIAGGGGGGGGSRLDAGYVVGGGGGAGGGQGGANRILSVTYSGAAGGGLGATGSNGTERFYDTGSSGVEANTNGAGGGRTLPGTSGAGGGGGQAGYDPPRGGGAGGGGGSSWWQNDVGSNGRDVGGAGGAGNSVGANGGSTSSPSRGSGGGGGGWGASGGSGFRNTVIASGTGGKAVNLNGNTVTWLANGTRWGAIS